MGGNDRFDGLDAVKRQHVKTNYASFLALKRLPPSHQPPLFWLYGFFHDVSKIPYRVEEPLLGEIRLQWWRDGLLKLMRGELLGHPVADGLQPYLLTHREALSELLLEIIDSFGDEIQKTPVLTVAHFKARFQQRYGALFKAAFLLCGLKTEGRCELFNEAGFAVGVADELAQLALSCSKGMQLLPQDLMAQQGLDYQILLNGADQPRATAFMDALISEAALTSWSIRPFMKGLSKLERQLLARWILAPRLYRKAREDRLKCRLFVSELNPLQVFFVLLLLRP